MPKAMPRRKADTATVISHDDILMFYYLVDKLGSIPLA